MKRKKTLILGSVIFLSFLFFFYSNFRASLTLTSSLGSIGWGILFTLIYLILLTPIIGLYHFLVSWLNKFLNANIPSKKILKVLVNLFITLVWLGVLLFLSFWLVFLVLSLWPFALLAVFLIIVLYWFPISKKGYFTTTRHFLLTHILTYFLLLSWIGNRGGLSNLLNLVNTTTWPTGIVETSHLNSLGRLIMDWGDSAFYETTYTAYPLVFSKDNRWLYFRRSKDNFYKINLVSKKVFQIAKDELPEIERQKTKDIKELNLSEPWASQYRGDYGYVVKTKLSEDTFLIEICGKKEEDICFTPVPFIKKGNQLIPLTKEVGVYFLTASKDGSYIAITDVDGAYKTKDLYLLEVKR